MPVSVPVERKLSFFTPATTYRYLGKLDKSAGRQLFTRVQRTSPSLDAIYARIRTPATPWFEVDASFEAAARGA